MLVLAAWISSLAVALATRNIHEYRMFHAISFVAGWATASRIAFTEVPVNRLWIVLGLPLALAIYATSGDLLTLGVTVSWALIALSLIAGVRAANLRQMLQQQT
jgi:hypothetical protein